MNSTTKSIAALWTILLFTAAGTAQETIRCARTPDISPDGKQVAFSYLGDIWLVDVGGGVARPVTRHEAYHVGPVFSPDGSMIAFTSNRHGSYDVFVVPTKGGKPRRVTFDSGADIINGWSPDGKKILFSSNRSPAFPPSYELFTVPVEGGQATRVSVAEGREGVFSPKGDLLAYVRGPGTWYRKGYRGAANDEIWICNADGSNNRRLTEYIGQDNSPMWSADGQFIYYVSDCCSTPANIVRRKVNSPGQQAEPITTHKEDGVRRARMCSNGEWIAYECGPDIWLVSTKGGGPRKLGIEVYADDKSNPDRLATFTQGASEFAVSPDEKHVAFVVHGELFLIPLAGGKATRLTDHPAYDHGIAWAPDGKSIIFGSDRGGREDLYLLEPDDAEHPELVKAHQFKVKPLTSTPEAELGVSFAPDGKRVAFIRGGQLWTMKPDGTDAKVLVADRQVFDYDWSPDSKWVVFGRLDASFASDLHIISAAGDAPARNITRYATFNGDVSWSSTGQKLAFISQRRTAPGAYVMSLQKPAVPGAPSAAGDIDWDDLHLRVTQAAPMPAEACTISQDGTKVAFRSTGSSGEDLWVAEAGKFNRITTGNVRPTQIRWSKRLPDMIYFRDGTGSLRMGKTGGVTEPARVPFTAKMTIRRHEEFLEMFDQSWRALEEHFYDPKFHGADWEAVRKKYRPLVTHMAVKEDLYALISLMLGELNASHVGITGPARGPEETTAELGLIFDEAYRGPGLLIAEVLKRGPADKRGIRLEPGEFLMAINGVELNSQTDLSRVLNDRVGETVTLQVTANPWADPRDPKARRRVEVQAADRTPIRNLMYERWVKKNAERVAEQSQGKLGYIHIPSMDDTGLDQFVRALYSDCFDKEAIVLDVRFNNGGFTHDQVLNYLGAREHTFFRQRYGEQGTVLRSFDRKWSKPLVLLINNRSFSDAEILPSAFRTLGLGKLVGQPTGGMVIGTSAISLIDGSMFRLPRTGVFTLQGVNMEKEGVKPDILVDQHPDELAKGVDKQLEKAVGVLLEDVAAWKKTRPQAAQAPVEGKPAGSEATPMVPREE